MIFLHSGFSLSPFLDLQLVWNILFSSAESGKRAEFYMNFYGGMLAWPHYLQDLLLFTFCNYIVPMGFLHGKFGCSLGKASCDSHATQPTVHAGYFSVSITHRTLTRTTGSLSCTQMLMHAIAHGGVWARKESLH